VRHDGSISAEIAAQALDMLNVDAEGFDYMDRKLLLAGGVPRARRATSSAPSSLISSPI
jgi:Holliday junction resolvasome RuvABC ATP-dependent DNA helicase subunit